MAGQEGSAKGWVPAWAAVARWESQRSVKASILGSMCGAVGSGSRCGLRAVGRGGGRVRFSGDRVGGESPFGVRKRRGVGRVVIRIVTGIAVSGGVECVDVGRVGPPIGAFPQIRRRLGAVLVGAARDVGGLRWGARGFEGSKDGLDRVCGGLFGGLHGRGVGEKRVRFPAFGNGHVADRDGAALAVDELLQVAGVDAAVFVEDPGVERVVLEERGGGLEEGGGFPEVGAEPGMGGDGGVAVGSCGVRPMWRGRRLSAGMPDRSFGRRRRV